MKDDPYEVIGGCIGAVVFIGCWIYCIASYGFLLGVGLGWLPSLIAALVAMILWPLALLLVIPTLVIAAIAVAFLMIHH